MSEPIPTDTPTAAPTPADMPQQRATEEPAAAPADKDPAQADKDLEHVQNLRKENRSLRERLKAVEPLAKKAQEADEAAKSETQKAIDRATKAEQLLQERETRFARLELAVQHNIPPEDIDLIGSGTREEMDANAKRLAALHAASMKAAPPPTDRPVEGLRPGAAPEPPTPADDSYPAAWTPAYLRDDKDNRSIHGQ